MTRNSSDTSRGDTKDTLLEELESIKGLLLEPEDDIPVLHEVIESIEPIDQETPRQSSLFTTNIPAGRTAAPHPRRPAPTKASGENPFLPAHIRARLHGNRPPPGFDSDSAPAHDTAPVPDKAPTPGKAQGSDKAESPNRSATDISREQLVSELLSELQPLLEAQLRDKLNALSQEQLRQLMDLEADASDRD